ncbi:cell division protein FtsQ/DivIB [Lachnoclostridium phytofermentans]|jgi:cell division protein FtsQ|uniref:cell division protein FtsQ/DivIB n=1 Tax=Lachnoclostridium phytofermentans TaxID=66219 RepID=UPI00068ED278|nr:cell division protein FtsQ/DivIB [Lachnoclostridium phytofermentans]
MVRQLQKKVRRKRISAVFITLTTLLIVLIAVIVLFMNFRLENVIVEGTTRYTEEEIKNRLITEKTDQITLFYYLRQHFSDPVSIPFVEKVDVSMENRNTIHVTVYEKLVVGCVEMMGGYLYFDKDGIVVESTKERLEDIPQVTGLKFDKIVLHEKLEIQKEGLFETILNVTKLIKKFELPIDAMRFNSDYELILTSDGIEVLLGRKDFYDEQLGALKNVLEAAGDKKLSIDMKNYSKNNKKIISKPLN